MSTLSKICVVIPYFGEWPFWMPFFLASCRENPSVDWLIYSDCGMLPSCPNNVRVVSMSYANYCEKVSEKLGILFQPKNPYKLCDIKPALGYIHQEELAEYDFWAFGDLDLVYGDLRAYFTESRIAKWDILSTHATRISGHFCLIRNTQELYMAFTKVKRWREKFINQKHIAFDEKDFSKLFLRHKNSPALMRRIAAWQDPWLKRGELIEAYTTPNGRIPWLDGGNIYPNKWTWDAGWLSCDKPVSQCFPYFHFMKWKRRWIMPGIIHLTGGEFEPVSGMKLTHFSITADGFIVL